MAGAIIPVAAAVAGYGGLKSYQNLQAQDANKLATNEASKMLLGDYGRTQTPAALPKVNVGDDGGVSFAPSAAPQPRQIGGGGLLAQGRTLGLLSSAVGPQAMLSAMAPSMLSKMFPAAPPAFEKLGPGESLQKFNPATGKYDSLASAPPKPNLPEGMNADGTIIPGFMNFKAGLAKATRNPLDDQRIIAETARANAEAKSKTDAANMLSDIPEGVTGPAVLNMLSPTERASVESIISGDQPLPTRTANPSGQRIAGLVSLADPTYNNQRLKVKSDVATGATSKNIKAIGTVFGHIDKLTNDLTSLGNYGGWGTLANPAKNAIAGAKGEAAINNVNLSANAVVDELENAFRGSGGSVSGIREWRKGVSPNLSPDQITGVKQTALDLVDQRLEAIANQWNQVMPASQQRQGIDFLSPKQRDLYTKLKGQADAPSNAIAGADNKPDPLGIRN